MLVFPPRTISRLADRLECAYRRRSPDYSAEQAVFPSSVWEAAAALLVEICRSDSALPLDPELYVASQEPTLGGGDPWSELTGPRAVRNYRRRIHRIIRQLRRELRAELRSVERRLQRGGRLEEILVLPDPKLSPLGRYLAACRFQRTDLAAQFLELARHQHRACPLYRAAATGLIPDAGYPVFDLFPDGRPVDHEITPHFEISLN